VYIGLDADGNLALFDGKPDRSKPDRNKVLQTFFQIDIEYLESSLPKQSVDRLYEGIRIHNYAQYNEVLSTFAGFAVEAAPR
jgi:forespore regulator of the sigma-K checkpoint